MTDEAIIKLFECRDQEAIGSADAAYGQRLRQLAENILHDPQEAEEMVSDAYWAAWKTIPPQKPEHLFAYLAQLCRRAAFGKLDWKKAAKRNARVVELTQEMEYCIPDCRIEQELDARELGQVISCFLETQPEEARTIFLRRYWYADSIREISQRLGIGESKVKTSLHRTRKKLKTFLEKEEFEV